MGLLDAVKDHTWCSLPLSYVVDQFWILKFGKSVAGNTGKAFMVQHECSNFPDCRLARLNTGSTRVTSIGPFHLSWVVRCVSFLVDGFENGDWWIIFASFQEIGSASAFLAQTRFELSGKTFFNGLERLSNEVISTVDRISARQSKEERWLT